MRQLDHTALADALLPVVLEAGRIEMHYYTTGVAMEQKADASPVSVADREAEACLIRGLWRAASGVPVIAEESAAMGQSPAKSRSFFLVDPLDGTREFCRSHGRVHRQHRPSSSMTAPCSGSSMHRRPMNSS